METQTQAQPVNFLTGLHSNAIARVVRAAFDRLARPALWKRQRELRVCETLSLGNRNFVAVLGYQDQRFLIGGTSNSISLLADVTPCSVPSGDHEENEEKDISAA